MKKEDLRTMDSASPPIFKPGLKEAFFVDLKLVLATGVREKCGLPQTEARSLSISPDVLVRALLGIGVGPANFAKWIQARAA